MLMCQSDKENCLTRKKHSEVTTGPIAASNMTTPGSSVLSEGFTSFFHNVVKKKVSFKNRTIYPKPVCLGPMRSRQGLGEYSRRAEV